MADKENGTGQFSFFAIYFHPTLEDYLADNAILGIEDKGNQKTRQNQRIIGYQAESRLMTMKWNKRAGSTLYSQVIGSH